MRRLLFVAAAVWILFVATPVSAGPILLTGPTNAQISTGSGGGEFDFFFSALNLPLDGSLVSFDFLFPSVVFIPANFTQVFVGASFNTSISGFPGFPGAGSTGSLTTIGKNVPVEVGRAMCSCGSFDVGLLSGPYLGPNVNTSALRLSGAHFDVYLPTVTGQMLTTGRVRVSAMYPVPEPATLSLLLVGLLFTIRRHRRTGQLTID